MRKLKVVLPLISNNINEVADEVKKWQESNKVSFESAVTSILNARFIFNNEMRRQLKREVRAKLYPVVQVTPTNSTGPSGFEGKTEEQIMKALANADW